MSARPAARLFRAVLGTLVVAVPAACDLGPRGPSRVSGTVTGNPLLGAVVLDLTWQSVRGFEGRGSTRVYSAPVAESPHRYRVILVDGEGGDLRFSIDLEDARLNGPVVTVVEAAGTNNEPLPVGDLRVVLER